MAEANPSIQQTATTARTRNGWGRPRYESGSLLLFFIPGSPQLRMYSHGVVRPKPKSNGRVADR